VVEGAEETGYIEDIENTEDNVDAEIAEVAEGAEETEPFEYLKRERPLEPPQISVESPRQAILHLPSVAAVEPAARELPQ